MTMPNRQRVSSGWYRSDAQQRATFARLSSSQNSMDNAAWSISSRLIAGISLYAALGWLLSRWFGNEPMFIAVGAMVGLGLAYILIFRDLGGSHREDQAGGTKEASGDGRAGGPA
jgi:F0F1-type ATP synthase assembly protein I